MGFSRPEYWSGLPCPPPGDLHNPGIEPRSPALQVDSLPAEPQGKPYMFFFGGGDTIQLQTGRMKFLLKFKPKKCPMC